MDGGVGASDTSRGSFNVFGGGSAALTKAPASDRHITSHHGCSRVTYPASPRTGPEAGGKGAWAAPHLLSQHLIVWWLQRPLRLHILFLLLFLLLLLLLYWCNHNRT